LIGEWRFVSTTAEAPCLSVISRQFGNFPLVIFHLALIYRFTLFPLGGIGVLAVYYSFQMTPDLVASAKKFTHASRLTGRLFEISCFSLNSRHV